MMIILVMGMIWLGLLVVVIYKGYNLGHDITAAMLIITMGLLIFKGVMKWMY